MNSEPAKVLVVDDEAAIRTFLRHSLDPAQFKLIEGATGAEGLRLAATENPHILLLDLGLPDMDGVEVTRQIRTWSDLPIIVLSVRDLEKDKVAALDAGADDYLTKPFSVGELQARLRVALRRGSRSSSSEPVWQSADLTIDMASRLVHKAGVEIHLTPNEFKLLGVLVRHAGRVVTHRQLLLEVWGASYAEETHYLRVYMGQLRHKLENDAARPRFLVTESGVGYRLRGE